MKEAFIIRKKLENNIMPYILSAVELTKTSEYSLYKWHGYSKDLLPLVAGAGLSYSPFINYLITSPPPGGGNLAFGVAGAISAVVYGFFKIRIGREEVTKRILGQKKIIAQFKVFRNSLNELSSNTDPADVLKGLIPIQQQITSVVNTAIQDDIWPWDGPKKSTFVVAKEETDRLISQLWSQWEVSGDKEMEEIPDQKIN